MSDALKDATPEQLEEWACDADHLAKSEGFPGMYVLAQLARAVAKMARHGAFVDGGAMPWTLDLGGCDNQTDVTFPTLPAALASLAERPE